jgi:acyl-CoA synthetase (AMP-forming)/AMP-acid ligase II
VVPGGRDVETVARAIAAHGVELLPTSPTFLKMLLISDAAARHDLSSLKLITYGTEVMPDSTLADLHRAFPEVRLKQTYGLSEIGIVPTRSRAPGSPWMQVGGGDVETKIVDGILWLRAPTAMLGYLNAPSPIDAEGWLNTGDKVLVDGDWLRILGRESELINVGGVKVHPSEVESVLLAAGNIQDVTVSARASPVTGNLVVATVVLAGPEEPAALRARLDRHCRARLEPYKVPAAYKISEVPLHSERFKKARARA